MTQRFSFAPPSVVLETLVEMFLGLKQPAGSSIYWHIYVSLSEFFVGFALGALVGVTVGVLVAIFRPVDWALDPWIAALYATPTVALAPLFIMWFGVDMGSKVAVVFLVYPRFGWRPVFFVGVAPALFVLWIRRSVPEPELWSARRGAAGSGDAADSWRSEWRQLLGDRQLRRDTLLATAMNALGMFGYWGLFTWVPSYLKAAPADGGRGLSLLDTTTWLLVMGVGKFLGYALFGFLADRFGRRRCYVAYLLIAALLVPLYGYAREPWQLLVLGPFVAFFGTGFFSGYSALAAELFPTAIRATAMGFTYNFGRGFAALAPWLVGLVADRQRGFTGGFLLLASAYLGSALLAALLPGSRPPEPAPTRPGVPAAA
jgi:MFS family permease